MGFCNTRHDFLGLLQQGSHYCKGLGFRLKVACFGAEAVFLTRRFEMGLDHTYIRTHIHAIPCQMPYPAPGIRWPFLVALVLAPLRGDLCRIRTPQISCGSPRRSEQRRLTYPKGPKYLHLPCFAMRYIPSIHPSIHPSTHPSIHPSTQPASQA